MVMPKAQEELRTWTGNKCPYYSGSGAETVGRSCIEAIHWFQDYKRGNGREGPAELATYRTSRVSRKANNSVDTTWRETGACTGLYCL